MKRLLNTLFITTQGTYLAREGDTVLVKIDRAKKLSVPVHTLSQIVCFGNVSCSPFLMDLCGRNNVHISFLTENGRFMARVQGPVCGNVLLRREQYRFADRAEKAAMIARACAIGKIANARKVVMRAARETADSSGQQALHKTAENLMLSLNALQTAQSVDTIRGIEGDAASVYFATFNAMIFRGQSDGFEFTVRSRRPPLDNINALLSFAYTLLTRDVQSALEGVGLDPAVGFLHCDRPGRPSLALDMMEEFRSFLADRLVLTLINRRQLNAGDFQRSESGAVIMRDDARKEVLTAWQKRKQETITHPFTGEKMMTGLIPHVQALLLARHIRGELEGYPPFLWN
jgi:CRISPR-associated protein Cas1